MNPRQLPIARELFAQWRGARGDRPDPATRPFSRGWEELLTDAGLLSAAERSEAERDAQALAADGWVELKPIRYRPHVIDRIALPLEQERRWREAFGFTPPTTEEARRVREHPWQPELAFLPAARLTLPFDELRRLDDFLAHGGRNRPLIPLYERSLELFGDEKRLDQLYRGSALFAEGRLTLDHLRCFAVSEPLGWKRGPGAGGPVIVLENLATWDTYCRWNDRVAQFSAAIYGGGYRFVESVGFLTEVFRELGGARRVCYFGDLDVDGLDIPQRADRKARRLGLPAIEPHLDSYRWLLERAALQEPCPRPSERGTHESPQEPCPRSSERGRYGSPQEPWPRSSERGRYGRPQEPWPRSSERGRCGSPQEPSTDDQENRADDQSRGPMGTQAVAPSAPISVDRSLCSWLGDLSEAAWTVLSSGRRLAQERVGWEFLHGASLRS